jgi:alkyl hydroperoxide reductase subunit AhpF
MEAALCAEQEVVVVGGGNSAGQAAVYLARTSSHVHLLVRGDALASTMSDYLVRRILSSPKITLHTRAEIASLAGDRYLRQCTWKNTDDGEMETRTITNLFVMIGAEPNTSLLKGCVSLDTKGLRCDRCKRRQPSDLSISDLSTRHLCDRRRPVQVRQKGRFSCGRRFCGRVGGPSILGASLACA